MRGSGKSNTLVTWAERLYDAGIPFVAIDPKGDWWGIRSSADGKRAGLSVPVFGGLHSDFPLEERLGARIADLLVTNNVSAVLDVSRLSISARARFLIEFCNGLMDRHQVEPLADDEIAAAAVNDQGEPYEASGGGFGNAMRKLRRRRDEGPLPRGPSSQV
jgi:hypothetical protein